MTRVPVPTRYHGEVVLALANITRFAFRRYCFEPRHHSYRVRTDGHGEVIVEITNHPHALKAVWKVDDRNNVSLYVERDEKAWKYLVNQHRPALSTYHWVQKLVTCAALVKNAQKYK